MPNHRPHPVIRLLAAARRRWRRLLQRHLAADAPHLVFHPAYSEDQSSGPYDLMRPYRILHYLKDKGLLRRGQLHRPRPASLNRLRLVHTRAYLESLDALEALAPVVGFTMPRELHDAFLVGSRAMVGGTIRATKLALRRRAVAINLGGGFHHAFADRGHGFSCFNDVAIAIRTYRDRGFVAPILVVDLDLHDGDGTRAIFADDPTVHTFSLHNRTLLDIPAVADTCVELGADLDDHALLDAVREHLPPVLAAVRPGLVFYLAGSDPHRNDRLGDWRLSHDGLVARDRTVLSMLRSGPAPVPVVLILAGGYGPHAWRHPAATFSWLLTGDATIRPPLDLELPLGHYRRLQPLFSRPEPGTDGPLGTGWSISEEDLPGLAGVGRMLFLGVVPRHGIEVILESSGLLDRLRAKGFRKIQVDIDLVDPVGHLLRVIDISGAEHRPLIELKLRRDLSVAPPYALLSIEWLLLQNARDTFVLGRPPLEGQSHPGLGLLRDVSAMLVVLCERLGLDGLTFRPSHFHVAEIARYSAVYLDPSAAARHEAVRRALTGKRLAEMSRAVADGRVVEVGTGLPFEFRPARMVVPVSARLREGPELADQGRRVAGEVVPEYRLVGNEGRRPR